MVTFNLLLVAVALFAILAAEVQASGSDNYGQPIPGRYICEFSGPDVDTDSQKLLDILKEQLPSYEVTMPRILDFSLFKAATIQIGRTARNDDDKLFATISTDHETVVMNVLKTVAKTGLIAHIYPVYAIPKPSVVAYTPADGSTDPSVVLPHKQTQVNRVHTELKNTGAGIIVGIVDSGVDYMHPALGGGFGPGYKVRYGRDLVGDDYNPEKGIPLKPDSDPMDGCKPTPDTPDIGHGTHVSGIIAGKSENFTGVAPDAIIGMWRIFSCASPTTPDEVIVEAMWDAYDTGVDLINLSLGAGFVGWPESALAVAAARITAKGVPVIGAAGNDGHFGAFSAIAPSVGQGVFSVASIDNRYEITSNRQVTPVPTADIVSSFSSIGASSEMDLKPNIAGIGGNVYSTLPRAAGLWGTMSGTSMAAPYVAGSTALYLKSVEGFTRPTPAYILEQFQNYAYQTLNGKIRGGIDSPYLQGAGLVQVYDTIQQQVHIVPGGISFNDTANMQKAHTLTITNNGNSIISYQLVNNVSVSVVPYGSSANVYFAVPAEFGQDVASLTFSTDTLEVQPGGSADVVVTVEPPNTDPTLHIMYGGFIQFKNLQGQKDLTVPYIGIVGNQRELPIFGNNTPMVTDATYESNSGTSSSHIYKEDDTFFFDRSKPNSGPQFIISLPNPTREIIFPLYSADGLRIGFAFSTLHNMVRSHPKRKSIQTVWGGTFTPELLGIDAPKELSVLPGTYYIGIEALKWLGDPNSQNDWETWISCPIQVI